MSYYRTDTREREENANLPFCDLSIPSPSSFQSASAAVREDDDFFDMMLFILDDDFFVMMIFIVVHGEPIRHFLY